MNIIDPVCGRTIKPGDVVAREPYSLVLLQFCSEECHEQYLADPQKYVSHDPGGDALTGTTEDGVKAPQSWRDDGDLEGPPTHPIGELPPKR